MGITIGINDGFSAALGGSYTNVEAYLGRIRAELRKYGISDARPFKSIPHTTPSSADGNSPAEGLGMQLVL
jgi:hypothetical protein